MRKKYVIASLLGLSGTALLSLASFPACSCLSVAQAMVGARWWDLNSSALGSRYPRGLPEVELRSRIQGYASYCESSAVGIRCRYPHELTLLRRTSADLTVRLDAERRVESVRLERADRYYWQP